MTESESTEILQAPQSHAPSNLFNTDDPNAVVERASGHAKALAGVVRQQNLTSNIQGREHVNVEGWTLLGSMLGVFPVTTWSQRLHDDSGAAVGWEARVEAQTMDGRVVGAAEAQCTREEQTWAKRDDFALRSMAQTRAVSKALRMPLGFVMQLAGFDATPTEEMPAEMRQQSAPQQQPQQTQQPAQTASEAQQRKIRATAADEPKVSEDALKWAISKKYGVGSISELTKAQASEFIEALSEPETRKKIIDAYAHAHPPADEDVVDAEIVEDDVPPEGSPL